MTAPLPAAGPSRERPLARHTSADGQVVGGLLVIGGALWLLQQSGIVSMSWRSVLSILLAALGVGLVLTVRRSGGGGLIGLGVVLTAVLVSTSSIDLGAINEGVGERTARPATVAEARRANALGVGSMQVDLRGLDVPAGDTTRLRYTLGVGELAITLPDADDVAVRVIATVQAGELSVLGRNEDGTNLTRTVTSAGYETAERRLEIEARVTFGDLQVGRTPFG